MLRRVPLVEGEIYHVYNRGAHKRDIFTAEWDYQRFQVLLYLANTKQPVNLRYLFEKYKGRSFVEMFSENIDGSLVSVFAYCLMPNHFHLVLRQKNEDGIALFMRKLATAYSMYFNAKYDHSGTLFQGRYKSKHVDDDPYLRWIFSYVHLNPLELVEPEWKEKGIANPQRARPYVNEYKYSSHLDYSQQRGRPEKAIVDFSQSLDALKGFDEFDNLLRWQQENIPHTTP